MGKKKNEPPVLKLLFSTILFLKMWFCANIRLCEFRTQGYTDKCTVCIRLFEILQITWGSHFYFQAFWDVHGARLETYCLDVDKIMKDFKMSHLGSPMRLTAFILLNLINNLNVFAFFFFPLKTLLSPSLVTLFF